MILKMDTTGYSVLHEDNRSKKTSSQLTNIC